MKSNNYTKLNNGEWGAFVNMKFDGKLKTIEEGTIIEVVTKNGETHKRIVAKMVKSYKSGVTVSLIPDEDIAKKASERYAAYKTANQDKQFVSHSHGKPCPKCGTYCYGDCEA